MALPILATVGKAARAAFPIIEGGVSRGLSATAINSLIRDTMGSGIRRQTLLDIMRAVRNIETTSSQLRFLAPDRLPNPNRLAVSATVMRRRYAFVVDVHGTHASTGAPILKRVTISTDQLLTRAQIEDEAQSLMEDEESEYGIDVNRVVLVRGMRAGEAGTL
jgi:hypothetical protein